MAEDDPYRTIAIALVLRHGDAARQLAESRAAEHAKEGERETAEMWTIIRHYVAEMLL